MELLAQIDLLRGIKRSDLANLSSHLRLVRLDADQVLAREGEEADEIFFVAGGALSVVLEQEAGPQLLARIEAGEVVGELALTAGGARTATIVAATDSALVGLDAEGFGELIERHPEVAVRIAENARERLRSRQLRRALALLFGHADPEGLAFISSGITTVHLPSGEVLFNEGDIGDDAYLLLSGRLRVARQVDGGKQEIVAEVVPGETVGELALLIDQPRAATVFAARDSTLGRLPRRVFDLIGSRYPQTMLEVTSSILRRLRTSDVRRRGALRLSVAVLPATNDSGVRHFAVDLARALGDVGTTYQLTRERIDEILGKPGIASASADEPAAIRLGEWLGEVEDRFEVVVYECDPEWTPWTERAIGHADLVLTVIDARAGPSLQPVEATLAETLDGKRHARRALVILHEASASPHRTGRWLDLRDVDDHFHVEMGARDDLARIARILSGRGLGVALGGGGARGLAHIGVLRCFEELHLPIDLIGGTSMGSVMGSLRALGLDHTQMTEVVKESFADTLDYTMPVVSLVKGRRATDSMRSVFGSRGIEDLTIPFFCISTNITRSRTVVHRVGDLTTAVRASGALPGVFPPVPFDGNLLVDGGVLNNLPADVVRRSTPDGRVVAVNVAPSVWSRARSDFGLSVSGFRALMDRLNPRRRPVAPPITSTLLRSMVVGSMRDRDLLIEGGVADLYLDLDLRGVGMLDFDAVDRVAATAYEAAMPQFEAWLERDPEVANLAGG